MHQLPVTAVIITKNEEQFIGNCLRTLFWCKEIIVIDSQSTDSTIQIAKRSGAIVFSTDKESFAEKRNYGLSKVKTPWILYIDADERISPELKEEIESYIENGQIDVISFLRKNIFYGASMRFGGWQTDSVTRLFRVSKLQNWVGKVHESPRFSGSCKTASNTLLHLSHRNMVDGLFKTIVWTGYEADLLFQANHPPVTVWILVRKTLMEFWRRAIVWKGYKDGIEGWISAMVQAMNRFIVYERLWELQQKPTLQEKYQSIDEKIIRAWEDVEKKSP